MNALNAFKLAQRASEARAKAWVRTALKEVAAEANKGLKTVTVDVKLGMDISLAGFMLINEHYDVIYNRAGGRVIKSITITWKGET